MQDFLVIDTLSKRFGSHRALDAVCLEIQEGEIFSLLGPSGCGKTTLLRLIAGFDAPDSGRILLEGKDVAGLPPERRPVNTVFQNYALFPHLTAAENVGFGLRRSPRDEREQRVAQMLALVGLPDAARRYPHELSGGQQQRIALARSLAPAPALLLLDEPFSNLDAATRRRLREEVRAILKDTGQTAVLVTHHEADAQHMADCVGTMTGGTLAGWSVRA